jgi:hypothetical protein
MVGDGETPETFTDPCGLTSKGFTRTANLNDTNVPDCDNAELPAWLGRDVVSYQGAISGNGVVAQESLMVWEDWWLSAEVRNVRIQLGNDQVWMMTAKLQEYAVTAERGEKVNMAVSIVSDGALQSIPVGGVIHLSNSTVVSSAAIGSLVGTLSVVGGSGTYTYSLTSNPGGLFAIVGSSLNVAASLSAGSKPITISASNGVDPAITYNATITVTVAATAPANTALPVISGTAAVGQTLTSTNGTWTGTPTPTYARQWKRNGSNIAGATSTAYLLGSADAGTTITVTVTATNTAGSANATSAATAEITGIAPANAGGANLPAISGSTVQGATLTATSGTWTGTPAPTYTYQWKSAGGNVGTGLTTYATVVGDVGNTITVVVTATNAAGSANATSAATAEITAAVGGAIATPSLTSLTTATDSGASSTDAITNDTTPDINVDWGADPPLTGDFIEVRNGGTLIVNHLVTAGEEGSGIVSLDFPLSAGSNSLTVTHKRGASSSSPSSAFVVVIDTTAPTLSSPTGVKTGITTATLGVTTNDATGTLYGVLTLNSTLPTAAQIKAGQNAAGSAAAYAFNQAVSTTTPTKNATGLTGSTTYYAYYMQEDVAGNQSTVPTGVSFTTDAAAVTLAWDPAKKNAGITLSNGNLTATTPANAVYASILASGAGKTTGKYYFEVTITAMNPDGQGIGFGNASADLTAQGGSTVNSVGWRRNGSISHNNSVYATIQTFAQGDVVAMAVDLDAKLVWFRNKTGGTTNNWNNSGTANPATGTGGITGTPSPGLAAGPYFPEATLEIAGDVFTANFGATAYAMTPPALFLNWDGSGGVPDTTAPTLTSPTAIKTGSTTAMLGVTTDETNGTLYGVLTLTSSTPTKAQIKAGQNSAGAAAAYAFNQTVSVTAQSKSAAGLTVSTTYYAYYMHEDASGNQSNIPTVVSFTTDATGFSVLALPGLIGWYDASVAASMKTTGGGTAINGQVVETWQDQSSAGNHLTVTAGNSAPTLNTTGMNTSFPTVVFNNTGPNGLSKSSYAIGTGNKLTAFVVATMATGVLNYARLLAYTDPAASASFDNIGSAAILLRDVGNSAINSAADGIFCTPASLPLDTPAIFGAIYTGSVFSVYMNNVRAGTGSSYSGAFDTGGKLGIGESGSVWHGRVSEIIICNADNTTDATNIYSYLQSKWGL